MIYQDKLFSILVLIGIGYLIPEINMIKNGIGNGTITAIDLKTGKTKWEYPTEFPT
jgi:outer membrane protein assembly factor BamB